MRKIISLLLTLIFGIFFTNITLAFCPVCTIAVGAGVGLSRWLGIDDIISGLWIGGLIISLIMLTIGWLDKKNIRFFGRKIIIFIGYYLLFLFPLYIFGIIGGPLNVLWGIDKLILGIVVGGFFFFFGGIFHYYLKRKNNNKVLFLFQSVVVPITPLIILSIIFYFLIR